MTWALGDSSNGALNLRLPGERFPMDGVDLVFFQCWFSYG